MNCIRVFHFFPVVNEAKSLVAANELSETDGLMRVTSEIESFLLQLLQKQVPSESVIMQFRSQKEEGTGKEVAGARLKAKRTMTEPKVELKLTDLHPRFGACFYSVLFTHTSLVDRVSFASENVNITIFYRNEYLLKK